MKKFNAAATAWARQQPIKDVSLRLLLTVIAGYANKANQCRPTQALLMADTQKSERAVRYRLRKLEEAGYIKVERRRNADGEREASLITLLITQKRARAPSCD